MRWGVALGAMLIGVWPAFAEQTVPKRVSIPSPVQTYASMSAGERVAIQSDLLWTGHYDGLADGEFNERSINAIRSFQRDNKTKQTGILNPQERDVLSAAARKERDAVGWKVVEDAESGSRIGFPAKLLPQWVKNKFGSRWSSARGEAAVETFRIAEPGASLAAVFNQQKQQPERKVESSQLRQDSFVITGLQGLKRFYSRAEYKNGEVRGFTMLYDQAMDGTMGKIVDAVRSGFVPFSRVEAAPLKAPESKSKVDYGTGIVISAAGHILTPRHMVDGCAAVVVQGRGNAEIVAQDAERGLALLRIYSEPRLSPLPLPAQTSSASDATLVGIADPKMQEGAAAASTTRVKLGEAAADSRLRSLDAAPLPGFSGAVALDANNQLLGMVQFRPQVVADAGAAKLPSAASVIPAETMQGFLVAQGVAAQTGSVTDAKASLVRVICMRK